MRTWQKPVAIVVGATGIGGLVVGTTLAAVVFVRKSDVDKNCDGKSCNAVGYDAQRDAWTLSGAATAAFIAGAALVAGGAVLYFTAPGVEAKAALRLGPSGAILEGTW